MNLPLLTSHLNNPKILWHQTDVLVRVNILLVDVQKYYLRIDRDRLSFSTCLNDTNYYVIINFFGAVIPEKVMQRNTGREIKIYIPKGHIGSQWLRLHLEQEKNSMIVVDPERVYVPEWKKPLSSYINVPRIDEYKNQYKHLNIWPDEPPSEDEKDSDDEAFDAFID